MDREVIKSRVWQSIENNDKEEFEIKLHDRMGVVIVGKMME